MPTAQSSGPWLHFMTRRTFLRLSAVTPFTTSFAVSAGPTPREYRADVAVIGIPDDKWGEAVKAVVICKPDAGLTADELIEWSQSRLAGFKRPRSVDFVDVIPRNPSGKILKKDLRAPYWRGQERAVH